MANLLGKRLVILHFKCFVEKMFCDVFSFPHGVYAGANPPLTLPFLDSTKRQSQYVASFFPNLCVTGY